MRTLVFCVDMCVECRIRVYVCLCRFIFQEYKRKSCVRRCE